MATMKYLNNNGEWIDYVEKREGLLVYDGENWIDGADNELAPDVSASIYDGAKWVRFYPNAHITYQHTLKSKDLKFTHTKNTSKTWGTGDIVHAKCGRWSTDAVYFGWLGLTKPSNIPGGVVDELLDVKCSYTRFGVGYWENPLPIALVPSTLTSAYGTGTTVNNSKKGTTIKSDTGMVVCSKTSEQVKGTTTFNNTNAKNEFKKFLNGSYSSIILGYKETAGDYIGLTNLELTFTYTCKVAKATFRTSDSALLSHMKSDTYEMMIFENELGLSYDEIVERRLKNNIKDIKEEDVIFE